MFARRIRRGCQQTWRRDRKYRERPLSQERAVSAIAAALVVRFVRTGDGVDDGHDRDGNTRDGPQRWRKCSAAGLIARRPLRARLTGAAGTRCRTAGESMVWSSRTSTIGPSRRPRLRCRRVIGEIVGCQVADNLLVVNLPRRKADQKDDD